MLFGRAVSGMWRIAPDHKNTVRRFQNLLSIYGKRKKVDSSKKSYCSMGASLQFFGGAADEIAVRGSSHASGSPELEARDQTHGE
jgi:hypothetical protein